MVGADAVGALSREIERLGEALDGRAETDWERPTGCPPWRVRDLLGHIRVAIAWLPDMLAAPAPARAEVSAAEYYRPDARFDAATNARRIALAQDQAATFDDGARLLADFRATGQRAVQLCRQQPDDRVVRTRHGDAMLLTDFLLTRVVEVVVHGLDLALALDREPWTTPEAADLVCGLLLGPDAESALRRLGRPPVPFIAVATGRLRPTDVEADRIRRLGIRWLTLG